MSSGIPQVYLRIKGGSVEEWLYKKLQHTANLNFLFLLLFVYLLKNYSRVRNRRRAGNKRRAWKICQKELTKGLE